MPAGCCSVFLSVATGTFEQVNFSLCSHVHRRGQALLATVNVTTMVLSVSGQLGNLEMVLAPSQGAAEAAA